jgi:hypothetical protein
MIPFTRRWKQADYGMGPRDIPVCPNCSSPDEVDEPWGFMTVDAYPGYQVCCICSCNIYLGTDDKIAFYIPTPGGFHEDDLHPQNKQWVPDRRPVPCRADG